MKSKKRMVGTKSTWRLNHDIDGDVGVTYRLTWEVNSNENHIVFRMFDMWVHASYTDDREESFFVTDLDGYELHSAQTIQSCVDWIFANK